MLPRPYSPPLLGGQEFEQDVSEQTLPAVASLLFEPEIWNVSGLWNVSWKGLKRRSF